MSDDSFQTLTGRVVDEESLFTLGDLCRACSIDAEYIISLVEEGVVEPIGKGYAQWRFSGVSLYRVGAAIRLQHDLGVNLSGAALVLDLMDEVKYLRARMKRMSSEP